MAVAQASVASVTGGFLPGWTENDLASLRASEADRPQVTVESVVIYANIGTDLQYVEDRSDPGGEYVRRRDELLNDGWRKSMESFSNGVFVGIFEKWHEPSTESFAAWRARHPILNKSYKQVEETDGQSDQAPLRGSADEREPDIDRAPGND
jgi:hypothetical protein